VSARDPTAWDVYLIQVDVPVRSRFPAPLFIGVTRHRVTLEATAASERSAGRLNPVVLRTNMMWMLSRTPGDSRAAGGWVRRRRRRRLIIGRTLIERSR
jgi:hypothetical protein